MLFISDELLMLWMSFCHFDFAYTWVVIWKWNWCSFIKILPTSHLHMAHVDKTQYFSDATMIRAHSPWFSNSGMAKQPGQIACACPNGCVWPSFAQPFWWHRQAFQPHSWNLCCKHGIPPGQPPSRSRPWPSHRQHLALWKWARIPVNSRMVEFGMNTR